MNNKWAALIACLVVSPMVCRTGLAAAGGTDTAGAEAAVREADADWAAMAKTGSVDAWMTFYAPDAIVMPPDVPMLTDKESVRQVVSNLLKLPRVSIAWHPLKVEVAASGDLAYVIGAYEIQYDDSRAAPVRDHGKILEIWRKQPEGNWRCSVDTWNSDGPPEAAAHAATTSARGSSPLAGAAAAPIPSPAPGPSPAKLPAPAAAPVESQPAAQAPASASTSMYGDMPVHYEDAIRQYFQDHLSHPDSVKYQEITKPEQDRITIMVGGLLLHEAHISGWSVRATVDAKNTHGAYVGWVTYRFLFKGEKIVHVDPPRGG